MSSYSAGGVSLIVIGIILILLAVVFYFVKNTNYFAITIIIVGILTVILGIVVWYIERKERLRVEASTTTPVTKTLGSGDGIALLNLGTSTIDDNCL